MKKIKSNIIGQIYSPKKGLELLLDVSSSAKFPESVDVSINLNVDPRKSDEQVRGSALLPKGLGKHVKVVVFVEDKYMEEARSANADMVGGQELIDEVKKNKKIDADWCVTTPGFMSSVSSIAKVLGPKGLMPNPKLGTVTLDIAKTIDTIKSGLIKFKVDKCGIIHAKIGNIKFSVEDLLENLNALISAIKYLKPSSVKSNYFKSIFVSSTMGKSFELSLNTDINI